MGNKSEIQWTDATWNVARGCKKVDKDCKYCYMYRQSLNNTRYFADQVTKTKTVFTLPLHYKETTSQCWDGNPLIFTSSLTDFFIEEIDEYRHEAWEIIRKCPHLTFQILTKRPERITACLPPDWGDGWDNVWLGTSVGSMEGIKRIDYMLGVRCKTRFLSLEPLHGLLDLEYPKEIFPTGPQICCNGHECGCMGLPVDPPIIYGFDWVIVGGESGNDNGKYKYRPCNLSWIEGIISLCKQFMVPVFVKQVGTYLAKEMQMSERNGGNFDEFPKSIQFREFPKPPIKSL
ncbi:MAG: DUF5131 family protein [Candidatus Babeliales bacterium]|nr:DUF5131 family protein [Candidatus Babeliales bacterium]